MNVLLRTLGDEQCHSRTTLMLSCLFVACQCIPLTLRLFRLNEIRSTEWLDFIQGEGQQIAQHTRGKSCGTQGGIPLV